MLNSHAPGVEKLRGVADAEVSRLTNLDIMPTRKLPFETTQHHNKYLISEVSYSLRF